MKVLNSYEIFNPETTPERLEKLLSLIMKQPVKILQVLPNDSTRIADEASLLVTDIVVELADHSIACVEIQKVGYIFPANAALATLPICFSDSTSVCAAERKRLSATSTLKMLTL